MIWRGGRGNREKHFGGPSPGKKFERHSDLGRLFIICLSRFSEAPFLCRVRMIFFLLFCTTHPQMINGRHLSSSFATTNMNYEISLTLSIV